MYTNKKPVKITNSQHYYTITPGTSIDVTKDPYKEFFTIDAAAEQDSRKLSSESKKEKK